VFTTDVLGSSKLPIGLNAAFNDAINVGSVSATSLAAVVLMSIAPAECVITTVLLLLVSDLALNFVPSLVAAII
jgi:hypothetical protein